ncbi:MAG: hypothetical protein OEN23_14990 [Paracoccaceae bacterium]|nr:hypothetical protein [Paracoccaceae bacterium]
MPSEAETIERVGSVLGGVSPADVKTDPYAHIVVDSPMSGEVYDRLAETFPPIEWFLGDLEKVGNNQAVRIPASQVLESDKFSPDWREFFRYHTSQDFWNDIVRVFGDQLRAAHPALEDKVGKPFEEWRAQLRGSGGLAEINLDLLFVINTAVTSESSVRPAHVDATDKIFSGLFYMKPEDDPTPGGDLALYRPRKGEAQFGGHYAQPEEIDETDVVGYTANRFIGFVNSPASLHGVTPRPVTNRIRRYINYVVETPFQAFEIPKLPLHKQVLFALKHRRNKAKGITLGQ